jgi:abequosyltransferase
MRLSFCITTRNRAASLANTLECILRQCPSDVEVVVVDGASTDNTVAVARELAEAYPQLKLVCPPVNSGLDADYDLSIQSASGEYCWLFGDDDLLESNAVERVLASLEPRPLVLLCDASVHNADFTKMEFPRRLPSDGPRLYAEGQTVAFFRDCIEHLTFIGAVVVQRQFWLSRERASYYGCEFIHCGVLFQAPIPGSIVVVREPLIKIRHGVGNWLSRWFEVWMFKWPNLVWSFTWIDKSVRARALKAEPWRSPARLIAARASGYYGWPQYERLVRPRARRRRHLVAPFVVAALSEDSAKKFRYYLWTTENTVQLIANRLRRFVRERGYR